MRCPEVRDLLHPFLDGELDVTENVSVLKHLELCAACRARSEDERQLREIVTRAAAEPVSTEDRQRLLDGALERAPVQLRRRRPLRTLALAASVLLAVGVAWGVLADPFCLRGCSTMQVVQVAQHTNRTQDPVPVADYDHTLPLQLPKASTVQVVGVNRIKLPNGSEQPLMRLRSKESGRECSLVRIPGGHGHFWAKRTREDGREYVEAHKEGLRLVAWEDEQGIWCCIDDGGLSQDSLFTLASAVRDAS